jgi:HPt (histidine-containing phosphotransfer) domain-containing protein
VNQTTEKLVSQLVADDPDMIDLVEQFVRGLPERVEEMRRALAAADFAMLRTLAHRLKGAGGSYGYPPISGLAASLEKQFATHDATGFTDKVEELERLIAAAAAGLES